MHLTAGTTLQGGKYLLNHRLGQGKLGLTFQATQVHLNQPVVIKTLDPTRLAGVERDALKQAFLESVRRFTPCQHPGLVRILDYFEEGELPFTILDAVPGVTLAEQVQTTGAIAEAQAIHFLRQAGSALNALHQRGLLHRDVKPTSLICPPHSDLVILVDYALLPRFPSGDRGENPALNPYGALELVQPQATLTPATDIYGLAATLYFLLTGQPPVPAVLRSQTPLPHPRHLNPQISPQVEAAILQGMQLEASARPTAIAPWLSLLAEASLPILPPQMHGNGAVPPSPPEPPPPQPTLLVPPPAAANAITPITTGNHSLQLRSGSQKAVGQSPRRRWLVLTALIAATTGLGIGLTLRLGGATMPGSSFFHADQSFPPLDNWVRQVEAVPSPIALPPVTPAVERSWVPPVEERSRPLPPSPEPSLEPEIPPSPAAQIPPPDSAPEPEVVPPPETLPNPDPDPVVSPPVPASATGEVLLPPPSAPR